MQTDTIQEKDFPTDFWIVGFWDLADKFLLLPAPPAKMWQQLLGHMASLKWFIPRGEPAAEDVLVCRSDSNRKLVPHSEKCKQCIDWWFPEERWVSGIPLLVLLPSFLLYTDDAMTSWDAHLKDLTTAGDWFLEKRELHINALEMKVVQLTSNAFFLSTLGKAVTLISNNATVMT